MNSEYAQNAMGPGAPVELSPAQKLEILKTGTTTIGILIKDGVILATESQATAGFFVATKKAQKLFKINDFVGATIAGGVADCQYVVGQAQAISRLHTIQHERQPSVEHMANLVRNILFNGRSYFYAFMIVGGYSLTEKRGKLYPIDFIGYMTDREEFVSLGSGSTFALGVLEGNWVPDMSEKDGIALVTQALTAARNRDAGSGYGLQICVITKDGFKAIEGPLKE
jgi:proteasome beta subunit